MRFRTGVFDDVGELFAERNISVDCKIGRGRQVAAEMSVDRTEGADLPGELRLEIGEWRIGAHFDECAAAKPEKRCDGAVFFRGDDDIDDAKIGFRVDFDNRVDDIRVGLAARVEAEPEEAVIGAQHASAIKFHFASGDRLRNVEARQRELPHRDIRQRMGKADRAPRLVVVCLFPAWRFAQEPGAVER